MGCARSSEVISVGCREVGGACAWVGSFLRHHSSRRMGEAEVQPAPAAGGGWKCAVADSSRRRWEELWCPRPQSCAVTGSPRAWSRASLGSFASSRCPTGGYLLKSCSPTAPVAGFSVLQGGRRGAAEGAAGGEGELLARHHWHELLVHLCNTTGSGGHRRGATRGGERGWRAGQATSSANKYMAHLNCTRRGPSCGAALLAWKRRPPPSCKEEKADLAQISVAMMSS